MELFFFWLVWSRARRKSTYSQRPVSYARNDSKHYKYYYIRGVGPFRPITVTGPCGPTWVFKIISVVCFSGALLNLSFILLDSVWYCFCLSPKCKYFELECWFLKPYVNQEFISNNHICNSLNNYNVLQDQTIYLNPTL